MICRACGRGAVRVVLTQGHLRGVVQAASVASDGSSRSESARPRTPQANLPKASTNGRKRRRGGACIAPPTACNDRAMAAHHPTQVRDRREFATTLEGPPHGRCQPVHPARRHRHAAGRRFHPDQGCGQEDRRRVGRRSGAQCAAGHRRHRRPRTAGGVGRGQGLAGQQDDPGAGGVGDQRAGSVAARARLQRPVGHAAYDDRWRLPVLRGRGKLAHKFLHNDEQEAQRHAERTRALADQNVDVVALERTR